MAVKAEDKERLKKEGRWEEFWRRRNDIARADGVGRTSNLARDKALLEFPPLSDAEMPQSEERPPLDVPEKPPTQKRSRKKVKAKAKETRKVSTREIVDFVFENMKNKDMTEEEAPSAGAYAYLVHCQSNTTLANGFYHAVWSKTLPTQKELEAEARFQDDGRKPLKLIEELRGRLDAGESLLPVGTEGPPGESGVSAGDDRARVA